VVQQSQLFRDLYQRWQGHQGLITTVLAPSAAQPVTPELMQCIGALFHVRQDLYRPELGLVNTMAIEPITRLGGPREYTKIGELFFLS
jgi:hypothetical protein